MQPKRPLIDRWLKFARREVGVLAILLLSAASLQVFVFVAEEVVEGETHALDRAVLLAFRHPANLSDPLGPGWFEEAARDISALGSLPVLTLVSLAVIGFLLILRKHGAALLVLISVSGGVLLAFGLKLGFARARPDVVPHAAQVFTASFPSAHAMVSAVAYLTLGALLARVQPQLRVKAYVLALAITLALLTGMSRVYLGVHWLTDVLAGWSLGASWALGCWLVAVWLRRKLHSRGRTETSSGAAPALPTDSRRGP